MSALEDRRRRRYPKALVMEAPGVWGAINDDPRILHLSVVRLLVVLERDRDPKAAFVRGALVGSRHLFGGPNLEPIPARIFTPPYVTDLKPPYARWQPGECLLVLTQGPVEAMAVLCALSADEETRP